ncbi:MAG TPA: ABC transporter ATP-binding protein [Caproicibacter sp.]|nr:ABC transporter ATP-binding protein [Caproicibacter sp.]
MNSNLLLDVNDLHVSFFTPAGEVKAVNGISYSLKYGEVLGVVGESGSGKSVSAYTLMGLVDRPGKIVGGTINFNGHQIEKLTEKDYRKIRGSEISIIFQDPMTSLNPVFTIGTQLTEMLKLHTNKNAEERKAKAIELLSLVGMNEPERRMKQYPHEFSGGMRQRVMIAMALACEPKLLIADEPTTALDVTIQAQILELMVDLKKRINMSVMLITHDLGVVSDVCDRIAVMYAGRIVEIGTTDEIFYHPKHCYTIGLLRSIPRISLPKRERLVPIDGTPVDLLNPPEGCPFAPRCEKCMKICLNKMPEFTQITPTHKSACWLLQKKQLEDREGAAENE